MDWCDLTDCTAIQSLSAEQRPEKRCVYLKLLPTRSSRRNERLTVLKGLFNEACGKKGISFFEIKDQILNLQDLLF